MRGAIFCWLPLIVIGLVKGGIGHKITFFTTPVTSLTRVAVAVEEPSHFLGALLPLLLRPLLPGVEPEVAVAVAV